jgi:hypothetical protein
MYISIVKCGPGLLFTGLSWPSVQVEFDMPGVVFAELSWDDANVGTGEDWDITGCGTGDGGRGDTAGGNCRRTSSSFLNNLKLNQINTKLLKWILLKLFPQKTIRRIWYTSRIYDSYTGTDNIWLSASLRFDDLAKW